jgi:hypothetical protein
MIGINKNVKQDSMIASDWDVIEAGYGNGGGNQYSRECAYSFVGGRSCGGGAANIVINGGQEGWVFASLTDAEVTAIMNGTSLMAMQAGTFPFLNKILFPVITTDATGNSVFTFNNTSICVHAAINAGDNYKITLRNTVKATYTTQNGKLTVDETAVPVDKNKITHLVFVRGQAGNAATGAMTIDPTQFAAFTVGTAGSGAEIVMSDVTIAPGKQFLMGSTPETSFSLTFATSLNVQQ